MNSAPLRILFLTAAWLSALAGASSRVRAAGVPEVPLVAIMSEALLRTPHAGKLASAESLKRGGALAGQVQLALGADARWAFVERTALALLEREHVLAAGLSSGPPTLRSGRLSHADWVLSIHLLATDLARPRLVAEVTDAFRAETLARIETDLRGVPDESWLLSPSAEAVEITTTAARRSLEAALVRREATRGSVVVAPLGFINRTRTDRLALLGGALRAALAAEAERSGGRVRLLSLDAVTGTLDESLLTQAGMSDLRPEDWARVADVFLWVEFVEMVPGSLGAGAAAPVRVQLTAYRGSGAPVRTESMGKLDALPELAAGAAKNVLGLLSEASAAASPGGDFTAEDRSAMAARLVDEARQEGAVKQFHTPQDRQRFERAARLVELAAFLAPEKRSWRELHAQMAKHLLRHDDPRRMFWADEFWRIVDEFLVGADGNVDLGLLSRGATWPLAGPPERFIRIGKVLEKIEPGRFAEFSGFAEQVLQTLELDSEASGKVEEFEALWPLLRRSVVAPADHERPILQSVYARDPGRGRAFFDREASRQPPSGAATPPVGIVSSPDPWVEFERPLAAATQNAQTPSRATHSASPPASPAGAGGPPLPPGTFSSRPRPVEEAGRAVGTAPDDAFYLPLKLIWKDDRFVEAPSESLDTLPGLEARWLRFSPEQVSIPYLAPADKIDQMAAAGNGIWMTTSSELFPVLGRVWFFDLGRHEIRQPAGFGASASPVSAFRVADGRVWMATQGEGIRVQEAGGQRRIDSSGGLLRDEISRLEIGRDAVFADTTAGAGNSGFLARIPLAGSAPDRAEPDSSQALIGLPAALRAAIVSFGPDARPRVRLPRLAGRGAWAAPRGVYWEDDAAPKPIFCRTGAGDGYWVSDGAALAWAAGGELREIARWDCARVHALADDGRNLFIAVSIQRFPTPDRARAFSPDGLRIYVYDHREGAWRGYLPGLDFFEGMSALPGALVFTLAPRPPGRECNFLLMNTGAFSPRPESVSPAGGPRDLLSLVQAGDAAGLGAALAAGADANAAGASGWTPLMAAVWADRTDLARRLLDAGARCDMTDKRGWHPLFIASAWSPSGLVQLLLDRGAKPDFQAPLSVVGDGTGRPGPRPSALHAAARTGRSDVIAMLLRAGASPALRDETDATPLMAAYGEASDAIVRQLVAAGGLDAAALRTLDLTRRPGLKTELLAAPRDQAVLDRLLMEAVGQLKAGSDLAEIRALLTEGADPFRTLRAGEGTAVRLAFFRKFFPAVELMIDHAPDLNRPVAPEDEHGVPPAAELLRMALSEGRSDIARRLFEKGFVPRKDDADRSDPPLLLLAVTKGDADIVRALRRHGFYAGDTEPLSAAIKRKDPAVLAALLEAPVGEVALARDQVLPMLDFPNWGNPLFAAIDADWAEGIGLLVAAGARRDACNETHLSLTELVRDKPALAVAFNHRPGSPDNTLEGAEALARVAGHGRPLPALTLTPAVTAYRDFAGETVLIAAARRGDNALVRALLAAGADVNAATEYLGETALTAGILACDDATIDALLAAGAPVDGPPGAEVAPLHIAAIGGSVPRVKRLLAAGASPTLCTPRRHLLPLYSAVYSPRDLGTLQALMETGRMDLTATDSEGFGVLEMAVTSDSPEKIQYLLGHGARWRKTQDADYHPMDVAASRGLTGSLRKLLQLGLRSPRALSLAKDDATRALLQSDADPAARIARDDEQLWSDILRDDANWRARAEARLAAGGDVNHDSARWGTPLGVAIWQDDVERVKFLIERGADPCFDPHSLFTSGEATWLSLWISRLPERRFFSSDRIKKTGEEIDAVTLGYIDLFWARETDPDIRAHMARYVFEARLPRATARLIELGASTRWAVDSFEKARELAPEERLRWAAILGIKK